MASLTPLRPAALDEGRALLRGRPAAAGSCRVGQVNRGAARGAGRAHAAHHKGRHARTAMTAVGRSDVRRTSVTRPRCGGTDGSSRRGPFVELHALANSPEWNAYRNS